MSENTEEIRQDLMDIRYFSEKMLAGLYDNNSRAQTEVLYELARYVAVVYHVNTIGILNFLVGLWNGQTAMLRTRQVSDDETRQTVFRFFGEMFGKYGLPDPGYAEDEL